MQMIKEAIALAHDLRNQFICFENEGLLKVGLIWGYKIVSRSGAFDPTSIEIQVDTKKPIVMKLADLESAYILTPPELVEFINNSVEMGAKAQETLARILETFKAQFSN